MPSNRANLDALIPRLNLDVASEPPPAQGPNTVQMIKAADLTPESLIFPYLRKPDFQRETAIWTPERVRDLVIAFINQDLIPAIILWRSPRGFLFVIDGAHRLSSLIAWVNNDYGTGPISNIFFDAEDESRRKYAKKTKELIEEGDEAPGSYAGILSASKMRNATPSQVERGSRLMYASLQVQTLTGDAKNAEKSFFKINQQGVPLTNTELTLLHSRECPNSIAARAINQRGSGYLHWNNFPETRKTEIVESATKIHDCIFKPNPDTTSVRSPDFLPIAGRANSVTALPNLLDVVNLTNGIAGIVPKSKEDAEKLVPPDADGSATTTTLTQVTKIIRRLSGHGYKDRKIASLSLHPCIYFYSMNGRHQPSAFLAVVELFTDYEKRGKLREFTLVREEFEEFLVRHRDYIEQVGRKNRGEIKAVHRVRQYLEFIINALSSGKNDAAIERSLKESKDYGFLREAQQKDRKTKKRITPGVISYESITRELEIARRCELCKARIPNLGTSGDHINPEGAGDVNNMRNLHPYCNSDRKQLEPLFAAKKKA